MNLSKKGWAHQAHAGHKIEIYISVLRFGVIFPQNLQNIPKEYSSKLQDMLKIFPKS